MICWNCGSTSNWQERSINGEIGCLDCKTILHENGKDTKPPVTSKIGSLTVDIKLGETPLEFAEKLITLLYEQGVAQSTIEDVEYLIRESLVREVNNTDRRKLFNLIKGKEVEKQILGQNSGYHYEFPIKIAKGYYANITMGDETYNKLMEMGDK